MMRYPDLLTEMRRLYLKTLVSKGITDEETIRREAKARIEAEEKPLTEENLNTYTDALIDLHFISHFSDEAIENHINLAHKNELFRKLNRVVNTEGATPGKIRKALREFCEIPQGDLFLNESEAEGVRVALINHFISNHLPIIGIAKHHLTIRDIDEMLTNSFSTSRRPGKIGGKATGLLIAHKILLPRLTERDPELEKYVTVPESYYFNSGIFSDFTDYNGLYSFYSQKYNTYEAIEENYRTIGEVFAKASFPGDVVEMFREFLKSVGEHPLILRSSSLLEDNFGFAFSGKYDSVFIANQGDIETRLAAFIQGLKQVHMSTFAQAPILYRRDHKLLDYDEKMSVLVQKVVGRRFGNYFFPFAAGVAFSHNPYRWTLRIRREEGIVRLVFGLGTSAVDRVGQGYPRLIPLSHPQLRPESGISQIMKYSQRMVELMNLESGAIESHSFDEVMNLAGPEDRFLALSTDKDGWLAPPLFEIQDIDVEKGCITFDNFLTRTPFISLMRKILRKLESAYGRPVDIEFAWDRDKLYLLQCRTLSVVDDLVEIPVRDDVAGEALLFRNNHVVSSSIVRDIEYVVYVDPKAYNRLDSREDKMAIGRVVSKLNRVLGESRFGMFGPGRWGSNDINLGVRVGYQDINRTRILAEIAFEENGFTPEVSLGTHFFSDLVEAGIVPIALYPDQPDNVFRENFFLETPNSLSSLVSEYAAYDSVVRVVHLPSCTEGRYLQVFQDAQRQKGLGFLETPAKTP